MTLNLDTVAQAWIAERIANAQGSHVCTLLAGLMGEEDYQDPDLVVKLLFVFDQMHSTIPDERLEIIVCDIEELIFSHSHLTLHHLFQIFTSQVVWEWVGGCDFDDDALGLARKLSIPELFRLWYRWRPDEYSVNESQFIPGQVALIQCIIETLPHESNLQQSGRALMNIDGIYGTYDIFGSYTSKEQQALDLRALCDNWVTQAHLALCCPI